MARGNRANRSIGGAGLEQGGPNMGNDYSRDISRESTADDTTRVVMPHNKDQQSKRGMQQGRKDDQQPGRRQNTPPAKQNTNSPMRQPRRGEEHGEYGD